MEEVGLNREQFLSMVQMVQMWTRQFRSTEVNIWKDWVSLVLSNLYYAMVMLCIIASSMACLSMELALDLFYLSKIHPAYKEDYLCVKCRWLTLTPAVMRIVDNWEPIHSYFLKEPPKGARAKRTEKNRRICKAVQEKDVLIQMRFLIGFKPVFVTSCENVH